MDDAFSKYRKLKNINFIEAMCTGIYSDGDLTILMDILLCFVTKQKCHNHISCLF